MVLNPQSTRRVVTVFVLFGFNTFGHITTEYNEQKGSEVMLHVNVPQLSKQKCRETLGELLEGTICAGHLPGGKDSCQVDSMW